MLSYAFVDAFTRVERHEAVARLEAAIADAQGIIVDFAFFSNEAVRITVEMAAGAVPRLSWKCPALRHCCWLWCRLALV